MRIFTSLFLAASLFIGGNVFAAETNAQHKVAIFVENRAGAEFNDKVAALEDLVTARVAGKGYAVVSHDVATRALKDYSTGANPNGAADPLDALLEDNSSALRLAQNLGADYLLIPAITSYGSEKKIYNGNGISTVNFTHTLRVNYKIVEAGEGGATRGGTAIATKNIRNTTDVSTESSDILNGLLDDAAGQLADAIVASAKSLPTDVAKAARVSFSIACSMTDPRQQPILISQVSVSADNTLIATNPPAPVQPLDVTVELDGVALGSAPGTFQAFPGLHKLRLSREGFSVWERTINVYDGQTLRVALQMSPEGYAKWKDTTDFLATLDNNRKLTEAEVNRINGVAKFYSESHYRVDTKDNIQINKSIY